MKIIFRAFSFGSMQRDALSVCTFKAQKSSAGGECRSGVVDEPEASISDAAWYSRAELQKRIYLILWTVPASTSSPRSS